MLTYLASGFGTVSAAGLMLFGLYSTVKTRGAAFRDFPQALRQLRTPPKSERTVSPFRAFATSLAGTVGVGNMTGVAVAIALGGAGAVFWMWISAFLCMTVKYIEIFLALRHQPKEEKHYAFAPIEYIRTALEGRGFAILFALLSLCSALVMGSMIQTDAAAEAAQTAFGISPLLTAIGFSAALALFFAGGLKRVTGVLEKILPLLALLFLLVGTAGILFRMDRVPQCLADIFRSAFSPKSAAGGLVGSGAVAAFRYGVGNGLFSHEAGLGSAGLAHGACGADPRSQGLWGILEVFFDTVVVSTLSALMILTSGQGNVLSAADSVLGIFGGGTVGLCLILFAFLSVMSWGCYGETCFVWLTGKSSAPIFRILFCLTPLLTLTAERQTLWALSETVNGAMTVLNLSALLGLRQEWGRLKNRIGIKRS